MPEIDDWLDRLGDALEPRIGSPEMERFSRDLDEIRDGDELNDFAISEAVRRLKSRGDKIPLVELHELAAQHEAQTSPANERKLRFPN